MMAYCYIPCVSIPGKELDAFVHRAVGTEQDFNQMDLHLIFSFSAATTKMLMTEEMGKKNSLREKSSSRQVYSTSINRPHSPKRNPSRSFARRKQQFL